MAEQTPVFAIRPTAETLKKVDKFKKRFPKLSRSRLFNILMDMAKEEDVQNYLMEEMIAPPN